MNRRGVIGSLLGLVGFGGSAVAKEDKQGDEFKIKVCDVYGREFKKSELDHYVIGNVVILCCLLIMMLLLTMIYLSNTDILCSFYLQ